MNVQLARAGAYSLHTQRASYLLRFSGSAGPMMRPLYAAAPLFALPPKGPQVGWQKIPNSPSKAMTAGGGLRFDQVWLAEILTLTVAGTPIPELARPDDGEDLRRREERSGRGIWGGGESRETASQEPYLGDTIRSQDLGKSSTA